MVPRIPRLTLFSGPNCSLCDTAKQTLSQIRHPRSFKLDIINIQDKGQEKWKKKYVYWIPALHLENKEIAKESSPGGSGWNRHEADITPSFFFHSTPDPLDVNFHGVYERASHDVLGETFEETEHENSVENSDVSRCFNCGDSEHKVTDCPFRLNRDLIALSRHYYLFHQGTLGLGSWKRMHEVEEWRQQRLNWLEDFEPGKIKGELLKEALGDEEWLRNISVWGYPRGWLSENDPRDLVRKRIWAENDGVVETGLEEDLSFEIHGIHGNEDHVEKISFRDAFTVIHHDNSEVDNDNISDLEFTKNISSYHHSTRNSPAPFFRWAKYPLSYFSSELLVLYVPPIPPEPWSSTIFEDTEAYLQQFSSHYVNILPPPPPCEEPPPLPPPPPMHPPRPISPPMKPIFSEPDSERDIQAIYNDNLYECDMDFSDSD